MGKRVMDRFKRTLLFLFSTMFVFGSMSIMLRPVFAPEPLIWEGLVFSSGEEVVSLVLSDGKEFQIVASDRWWYSKPDEDNLAADAQFYTNDSSDSWDWKNHFQEKDGHSFLQINGQDVDWGAFSNGDTGHTYTITYTGQGLPIVFRVVDWIDGNYTNNECKMLVRIYGEFVVGGQVADPNLSLPVVLLMVGAFSVIGSIVVLIAKCRPRPTSVGSIS